MENSISALPNYSGLHNSFYNKAKAKFNDLLNNPKSGNVEIKEEIPTCNGDRDPQNLKIALHVDSASPMDPNSRTVTLRSLTNPSVAVTFNAISSNTSKFSPDDKLFTALDFIFKLVPQDFNSIDTYSNSKPQERDINISIDDDDLVTPYQYTTNELGKLVFKSAGIVGLSISKAPESP